MAHSGSNKKVANGLVALSSAAVLAVYAAGYSRTRSAADQLEAKAAERRPAIPNPPRGAAPPAQSEPAINLPEASQTAPQLAADKPAPAHSEARDTHDSPGPLAIVSKDVQFAPPPTEPAPAEATQPAPSLKLVQPLQEAKTDSVVATVAAPPAAAPSVPPPPAPAPPAPTWKDGTYTGWGTSRHGDIQASVIIEGGRIVSATIAQCLTRYSCSVIEKLPPEVPQRQSAEVDYVSGATQSANAFYYAVTEALGKAK